MPFQYPLRPHPYPNKNNPQNNNDKYPRLDPASRQADLENATIKEIFTLPQTDRSELLCRPLKNKRLPSILAFLIWRPHDVSLLTQPCRVRHFARHLFRNVHVFIPISSYKNRFVLPSSNFFRSTGSQTEEFKGNLLLHAFS